MIYNGLFKVPLLDELIKKSIEANERKLKTNPQATLTGLIIEPHYPVFYND